MVEIAPSILSADFRRLGEQIAAVEQAGASIIHVDVMDGHFAPNLTVGPFIVEWVRKTTKLPIDAHLMIENPDNFIAAVDYVLLMSVNPGFSGQKFIPSSLDKLRRLRDLIRMKFSPARIEIDGGVGLGNAAEVVAAGAEILVAGSAVFGAENPAEALKELLRAAESGGRVTA